MTPVSNNNDPHQLPKGNLEELFRQKLAEAELTPRADVWDRLDHELLLRENQGYRRRLVGYRRLAAAACAVATLGVGGWLSQRYAMPAGPQVAATGTAPASAETGAATAARSAAANQAAGTLPASAVRPAGAAAGAAGLASVSTPTGIATETSGVRRRSGQRFGGIGSATGLATASSSASFGAAGAAAAERGVAAAAPAENLASRSLSSIREMFGGSGSSATEAAASDAATGRRPTTDVASASVPASTESLAGAASVAAPTAEMEGAAPANLGLAAIGSESAAATAWLHRLQPLNSQLRHSFDATLPTVAPVTMPALAMQDDKKPTPASRWHWRAGYSAQRFAPNVSSPGGSGVAFQTPNLSYQPAVANRASSVEPTQLQAGLAQRVQVGAAMPLGRKHWTLLTGLELSRLTGRTGREVAQVTADQSSLLDKKLQTGNYQLTTLGVPAQVRYEARKQGWGVYAAVGAAVNVLLHSRTSVGEQTVVNDPGYRSFTAAARANAGVRFISPGGGWQLNLGPEAEASLTTLNTTPVTEWSQRTRPYSLGLAASVEFGGGKAEAPVQP